MKKKIIYSIVTLMLAISAGVASSSAKSAPAPSDLLNNLPDGGAVVLVDVQKVLDSSLFTQGKLKSMLDKVQGEIGQAGLRLSDINAAAISFPAAKFGD